MTEATEDEITDRADLPDIVNALAASPGFEQDGVCFAARTSGLYRSEDQGRTWEPAYGSLGLTAPLATTAIAVSPDFPTDGMVFAGVNGGVVRSADRGASWFSAILPSPPPLVIALAVSPNFARDGVVLAGTLEDGVFRSADRGSSWAAWNFGLLDLNVLCLAVSPTYADDETLFAGTTSGLFRSTNGGRAWRDVDFPPDYAPVLSVVASPNYADDGLLFVGTEFSGLLRSDDYGRTWTRLGEDVMTSAVNAIVLSARFPANRDLLVLLNDTLLISRDGGTSWSDWQAGLRFDQGAASIAAPQGLDPDAPLLVGLVEGGVARL